MLRSSMEAFFLCCFFAFEEMFAIYIKLKDKKCFVDSTLCPVRCPCQVNQVLALKQPIKKIEDVSNSSLSKNVLTL